MSSNVLPAYVPYKDVVPFRNEKELEANNGIGEYKVSVIGVIVHAFAIPTCIVVVLSMIILYLSYRRASVNVVMGTLFLACILQIILSFCSLFKCFFTNSKTKFIRHALTSVIPALFATAVAIVIADENYCSEAGLISGPILLSLFYVPYYYYLTDEKSFLRPYVKAN